MLIYFWMNTSWEPIYSRCWSFYRFADLWVPVLSVDFAGCILESEPIMVNSGRGIPRKIGKWLFCQIHSLVANNFQIHNISRLVQYINLMMKTHVSIRSTSNCIKNHIYNESSIHTIFNFNFIMCNMFQGCLMQRFGRITSRWMLRFGSFVGHGDYSDLPAGLGL